MKKEIISMGLGLLSMIVIWGAGNSLAKAEENPLTEEKWWAKVEAESGALSGTAKTERFFFKGWTVVSFLDKGEKNAVTLTVNSEFEDEVQMMVRYRSGEKRNLCYKVNEGTESKIYNLYSGSWDRLKDAPHQEIRLEKGENTIKFYASEKENGPGLDCVIFSRNGGTEDDMVRQEIKVKFVVNGSVQGEEMVRTYADIILPEELPSEPVKEGEDFLGWYWGSNSQYEGVFPLRLTKIPKNVRSKLGNELVFTAKFGHNTPGNPVEKEGYRLIFQDEFDNEDIDRDKWVDRYLSSWSLTAANANEWITKNGIMHLQIREETQPWCEEYDGATIVSGFTTGQRNGLHNWNGNNKVRNPEDTMLTHINQYGYYEMRAKCQQGSARHSAWWLLGFEDIPEESAEIDIFEVKGKDGTRVPPNLHSWNDSDAVGSSFSTYINKTKDFNNEYHVYGFDWQKGTSGDSKYPDKVILYVDGKEVSSAKVNIDYPMIQLISLYEKREGGWTGSWEWQPYPNSFEIDYVRVYKKLPEGQRMLSEDELQVVDIKAENLILEDTNVELRTYADCDGYREKLLSGTKSYVRIYWNDGVETQEPVQWEKITEEDLAQIHSGKTITKVGYVPSIQQNVTMKIGPRAYSMENLSGVRGMKDLDYVFDGLINEAAGTPSGEFKGFDFSNNRASIIYDFQETVNLKGMDIWCNYGNDQGIKKMKVAVWDEEQERWVILKDEDGTEQEFIMNWQTAVQVAEKQSIAFPGVDTKKVKIIILDAGYKWNKFSIREIEFQS